MKQHSSLLTLRHCLLFLCTFGIPWLAQGILPSLFLIALAVLIVFLSELLCEKKEVLRYVPLVLWALLFLPQFNELGFLSKTIPLLYSIFRIAFKVYTMTYDQSRTELYLGIALYAFVALFSAIENAEAFFSLTLFVFLSWLALSTFMLRMLKNPDLAKDRQFILFSGGVSLGMLGVIYLLLSKQFSSFLKAAIQFIYANILLRPVLWFLQAVTWLFRNLYDLITLGTGTLFNSESEHESVWEEIGNYNQHYNFFYTDGVDRKWLFLLIRILAVLLFILIAWIIVHNIKKRTSREESGLTFTKESGTSRARRKQDDQNPSSRIRTAYRKYLKLLNKQRVTVSGSETSDIIAAKTNSLLHNEDASKLRELWLPVRYGNGDDAKAKEAEQLYRSIKKQFKEL